MIRYGVFQKRGLILKYIPPPPPQIIVLMSIFKNKLQPTLPQSVLVVCEGVVWCGVNVGVLM